MALPSPITHSVILSVIKQLKINTATCPIPLPSPPSRFLVQLISIGQWSYNQAATKQRLGSRAGCCSKMNMTRSLIKSPYHPGWHHFYSFHLQSIHYRKKTRVPLALYIKCPLKTVAHNLLSSADKSVLNERFCSAFDLGDQPFAFSGILSSNKFPIQCHPINKSESKRERGGQPEIRNTTYPTCSVQQHASSSDSIQEGARRLWCHAYKNTRKVKRRIKQTHGQN